MTSRTDANRIRIGLLGAGRVLGSHIAGFKALEDRCTIVAVAKARPDRDQGLRELVGDDVRLVDDYRKVIDMDDIDAVDILLPHHLHLPAAEMAARAGKHVLVEKVMARNVYECDRMIEACEAAGVTLTVCQDRRYDPAWTAIKRFINTGLIGPVHFWKLEHNQDIRPVAREVGPGAWQVQVDRVGGGAVMSCLTHQIDGLRWFEGEAEYVTSMSKVLPDVMNGELFGVVAARMQSGALAELSINWATRIRHGSHHGADNPEPLSEMIQATGEKGEVLWISGRCPSVLLFDDRGQADDLIDQDVAPERGFRALTCGTGTGHQNCIEEWIRLLRGEQANVITSGRDIRGTIELAEAAYRSERTGRTVHLPIAPQPWPSW